MEDRDPRFSILHPQLVSYPSTPLLQHSNLSLRLTHAAVFPPLLPLGNNISRYSPSMRQTSMADRIPASLPLRWTSTDPIRRLAISKTTSLSGARKGTT